MKASLLIWMRRVAPPGLKLFLLLLPYYLTFSLAYKLILSIKENDEKKPL